jgi:hypothetical protein
MHKYAIGVFNLPIKTEINDCPIGLMAKLHNANKSTSSTRKATQCQQGVSIDSTLLCNPPKIASAFVASAASMAKRVAYSCHFRNTPYGAALRSKTPPSEWLTKWLATKGAGPMVDSKYVQMHLGRELGRCQEVLDLFTQAWYAVEPMAPNSSHQNGHVERPHRDI